MISIRATPPFGARRDTARQRSAQPLPRWPLAPPSPACKILTSVPPRMSRAERPSTLPSFTLRAELRRRGAPGMQGRSAVRGTPRCLVGASEAEIRCRWAHEAPLGASWVPRAVLSVVAPRRTGEALSRRGANKPSLRARRRGCRGLGHSPVRHNSRELVFHGGSPGVSPASKGARITAYLECTGSSPRAVIRARPFRGPWVEIPRRGARYAHWSERPASPGATRSSRGSTTWSSGRVIARRHAACHLRSEVPGGPRSRSS